MPIINIRTNIEASKIPASLHTDLVKVVAEELRTSEKVSQKHNVWILVETDLQLTKEGAKVPLVMVSVESVGRLRPKVNVSLGTKLEQYFMSNVDLPAGSFVVRYIKHSSQFIYYNGQLVNPALDFDEDLE